MDIFLQRNPPCKPHPEKIITHRLITLILSHVQTYISCNLRMCKIQTHGVETCVLLSKETHHVHNTILVLLVHAAHRRNPFHKYYEFTKGLHDGKHKVANCCCLAGFGNKEVCSMYLPKIGELA